MKSNVRDQTDAASQPGGERPSAEPGHATQGGGVASVSPAEGDAPAGSPPPARRGWGARLMSVFVRGVLPVVVIVIGTIGAAQLVRTTPHARQRPGRRSATLAQTRTVERTAEPVIVEAMGTVIAARQVVLQSQVSGTVVELNPSCIPGGQMKAGEVVLVVDPAEYEAALDFAEATLARRRAELQSAEWELTRLRDLEARQAVNKKELADGRTAKAVAEAEVAAARALLEQARLDLSRTTLRAPFNGIITNETVDLGAQVTPQTQLATLVGTDEYWLQVSIPVDRLKWIAVSQADGERGSAVRIHQQLGAGRRAQWSGTVIRLLGDLEPQGRMARLLVSVRDPLGLEGGGRPLTALAAVKGAGVPLLIGSYVNVDVEGPVLSDVVAVGRDELHEGQRVWIMNDDDQLELRPVEIVFRSRDRVLVSAGLAPGDRLVVSDLPTPVAGMPLRAGGSGVSPDVPREGLDPPSGSSEAGAQR